MFDHKPDRLLHGVNLLSGIRFPNRIGHRIVSAHADTLPHHHRRPAGFGEQLVILAKDLTILTEQCNFLAEAVGDRHVAAIVPERAVVARRAVIMENEEVTNARIFLAGQPVDRGFLSLRNAVE